MLDATVFTKDGASWVSLRLAGEEIDVAGPFDDTADAVMMAERSVCEGGRVTVAGGR